VSRRPCSAAALVAGVALVACTVIAIAQEGHPLVGTWYGDWGATGAARQERHDVTIVMTWDGKTIGGTIDPGPEYCTRKNRGSVIEPTLSEVPIEVEALMRTAKEKIEIKSKAELFGDVRASKLVIEEGVTFVGKTEVNPNKVVASAGGAKPPEPPKPGAPAGAGMR